MRKENMEQEEKEAVIGEIAQLIESDPNATVLEYAVLKTMELQDLLSVRDSLLRTKQTRSYEAWYEELSWRCGKA